jgi:S-DNA-T family DNA segregation ATPase FtsK/SpoIIIE
MPAQKQGASKKPRKTAPPVQESTPASHVWMERAFNLMARFTRFGWDLLGTILVAFAILTILALLGLTSGTLVSPLEWFLRHWLGWGSWLVPMITALGGFITFGRRRLTPSFIRFSRVIALEGAALTLLPLLAVIGGTSLERAEAGLDGGVVGWGLAELPIVAGLPAVAGTLIFGILFAGFSLACLNLGPALVGWIDRYFENPVDQFRPQPVTPAFQWADGPARENISEEPTPVSPAAGRKKQVALPAEYRKSFRVAAPEVEQPIAIPPRDERLPPLNLLMSEQAVRPDERHINLTAGLIEKSLAEFGVPAKVVGFRIGPTVTQFAVEPGYTEKPGPDGIPIQQKVRVAQISGLARDLTLALSAERLRIEAPVPGASYVGIEVPNSKTSVVRLRSILESDTFYKTGSPLAVALGRDVSGRPVVADLSRMPHVLIAGTTGSGKSVCIEALTACLVMNNTPEDLRLVMIDPKMVELVRFNGLPHLYGKVETNLERILAVLRWVMAEMDHRYRMLENAHVRDIASYNRKMEKRKQASMPRIVVLIDELADLMMSAPDQTEHSLVRLAQMARATGIHMVVATQRPSTDVVTGLIKANFPARLSFTVASSIDSRVILDTPGAETLLGRGDMLFLNPESGTPMRAQGVLVTDQEIERVITFWQKMLPSGEAQPAPWEELMNENQEGGDSLVNQAVEVVRGSQHASASLLQRRLRIGYPRAARLIDELEDLGVVGPSQGGGREREVLIGPDDDTSEPDEMAGNEPE